MTGGTVVAPGFVPGGHGGWKFRADEGVVFVGLFFAVLPVFGAAVGFVAVLLPVPVLGVVAFAAAVPVPTPAGTHGIVVGVCGTVVGVGGVGAIVPDGVGCWLCVGLCAATAIAEMPAAKTNAADI